MTSEKTLDWMEGLARSLVHRAARRAPGPLSERLTEEWFADMSERPLGLSRLRFALGCCWATMIIARERGAALPVASGALATASHRGGDAQIVAAFFSRRSATFLLVASLHAAILGGLMLSLTTNLRRAIPPPFQTRIIDAVRPPIDRPTIDKPVITDTVIVVPRIDDVPPIDLDPPVVFEVETAAPVPADSERSQRVEPAAHVVSRIHGGPGIGFPSADEFYPSSAIRKEEQGVATISACVDTKGRLTSDPSILESTGSATLDEGALRLARAGSGHYQASTEDGRAVNSCYSFRIRFALRKHQP